VIAAAPMRERRRGGVWVAGGARAIGDNQGAVSRCKAHFLSYVQNNSQAMTVNHVLATMVEGRVSRARRGRDHSRRRSQPTPSSCVGKLREYRRTGRGRPREGADVGSEHRWNSAVSSMQSSTNG
jgi:hypothetical protein